jgi:spore maturation protein CgeB
MKILLAAVHFHSSFGWSISQALQRAGHELIEFEYRHPPAGWPQGTGRLWRKFVMPRRLLAEARRFGPDLLWIAKGEPITGALVRAVRDATGCRAVNWFPDPDLFGFANMVDQLPQLNLLLSKNRSDVDQLQDAGPPLAHMMQHCADRALHLDYAATSQQLADYSCDVAIVGTCYPYRESLVARLLDYDLRVWGRGWHSSSIARQRPECVAGTEARSFEQATVFQGARVNLNTHHPTDGTAMNQRLFDIAGSGGCQLVDGPRDLDGIFEDAADLYVFDSPAELRTRLDYLLQHPDSRSDGAQQAKAKVANAHTYDDRVAEILRLLESGT